MRAVVLLVMMKVSVGACAQVKDRLSSAGFRPIFDGRTLNGWRIGDKTGHGTGGKWFVKDGAIHGTQDRPGNGGILLSGKLYGDFEVELEMRNDYGPDSGLFLRSTEKGQAYQAMIDFHADGNLMGIYGEGLGGFVARNFDTLETEDRIKVREYRPFPLPFAAENWTKVWKPGRWNTLRARIVQNPPAITTWINGVRIMEFVDTEKRLPDVGHIALQVHGGGDWTKHFVRYRNIRVREFDGGSAVRGPGSGPNVVYVGFAQPDEWSGWLPIYQRHAAKFALASGGTVKIVPFDKATPEYLRSLKPDAVVLSGFARSFQDYAIETFRPVCRWVLEERRVPILALCGSHQLLGFLFNGRVFRDARLFDEPMRRRAAGEKVNNPDYHPEYFMERGFTPVTLQGSDPLFAGMGREAVFMESHYCEIKTLPSEFTLLASTAECRIQAMRHRVRPIVGVQFHPEDYSTEMVDGLRLLRNFFTVYGVRGKDRN